jgi:hypothetical protein
LTKKEMLTLDGIGEDLREMKGDVKSLLSFQAKFTEKCNAYDDKLKEFDEGADHRQEQIDWLNRKMWYFGGAIAVIVFLIDKIVRFTGK